MSNVMDANSIPVPNTDAFVRNTAPTMRIAAGLAAATISVGAPTITPAFLASASMVREGATSLRVFDTSGTRNATIRAGMAPSMPKRNFEAERQALRTLRENDRRGMVWRGIKGALGLGPRFQVTTPDDRVATAVDRLLSVRSRGVH